MPMAERWFLGIEESSGKPAVAQRVLPIADCELLAERLKLVFRNCVDPQLSVLEVKAVRTAESSRRRCDSHTAIAIGARTAPHPAIVAPSGVGDRCEGLTMREIQDMTLNVARGMQRLDETMTARRKEFERQCEQLDSPSGAFGFRITAVPAGQDLRIDSVVRNGTIDDRFAPPALQVARVTSSNEPNGHPLFGVESDYEMTRDSWVPRLRAVCAETFDYSQAGAIDRRGRLEVHCDGVIESAFLSRIEIQGPGDLAAPMPMVDTVLVAELAKACLWADQIRSVAGALGAEYAVEVEIRVTRGSVLMQPSTGSGSIFQGISLRVPSPGILFPRSSLGQAEETGALCEILERDLWNALGKDVAGNQGNIRVVRS